MKPTNRVTANHKCGPQNIQSKTSHSEHRRKGEPVQQTAASGGRAGEPELDEFAAQLRESKNGLLQFFNEQEGKLAMAPARAPAAGVGQGTPSASITAGSHLPGATAVTELRCREATLCRLLKLTPRQSRVIALIAEWEGASVFDYCRETVIAYMQASYDDMRGVAECLLGHNHGRKERAWAEQFYSRVKALLDPEISANKNVGGGPGRKGGVQ